MERDARHLRPVAVAAVRTGALPSGDHRDLRHRTWRYHRAPRGVGWWTVVEPRSLGSVEMSTTREYSHHRNAAHVCCGLRKALTGTSENGHVSRRATSQYIGWMH